MPEDIFSEDSIDDLVSQLKESNKAVKKVEKQRTELNSDNLEAFILKTSGALIEDSLDVIANVKDYTAGAPDARESTSLAELIKAASGAIDTLNKVLLQNKKSQTQLEIKEIDVKMKQGLAVVESSTKMLLSREELMKELIVDAHSLDIPAEVIPVEVQELPNSK
jgi:hypothetical protein